MNFDQLEDLFYALKIAASPSGYHGFLCGRLSCGPLGLQELIELSTGWLALDEQQAEQAEDVLQEFYQSSLSNLRDFDFIFQPLLPADELPIAERLVAVGEWCGSYISGLGEGMGGEFEVSNEGKEALEDIAAIAQISTDFDDQQAGGGEKDYSELVEYIRIAVQLVFADLNGADESEQEPTIH